MWLQCEARCIICSLWCIDSVASQLCLHMHYEPSFPQHHLSVCFCLEFSRSALSPQIRWFITIASQDSNFFLFGVTPQEWLWVTAHFPAEQHQQTLGPHWLRMWKSERLQRSSDTWSMLARYINIMRYCFHVRAYIIKKKLLYHVILHQDLLKIDRLASAELKGGNKKLKFTIVAKKKKKKHHKCFHFSGHSHNISPSVCWTCSNTHISMQNLHCKQAHRRALWFEQVKAPCWYLPPFTIDDVKGNVASTF